MVTAQSTRPGLLEASLTAQAVLTFNPCFLQCWNRALVKGNKRAEGKDPGPCQTRRATRSASHKPEVEIETETVVG